MEGLLLELQVAVLRLLPARDVLSASLACRALHRAAQQPNVWAGRFPCPYHGRYDKVLYMARTLTNSSFDAVLDLFSSGGALWLVCCLMECVSTTTTLYLMPDAQAPNEHERFAAHFVCSKLLASGSEPPPPWACVGTVLTANAAALARLMAWHRGPRVACPHQRAPAHAAHYTASALAPLLAQVGSRWDGAVADQRTKQMEQQQLAVGGPGGAEDRGRFLCSRRVLCDRGRGSGAGGVPLCEGPLALAAPAAQHGRRPPRHRTLSAMQGLLYVHSSPPPRGAPNPSASPRSERVEVGGVATHKAHHNHRDVVVAAQLVRHVAQTDGRLLQQQQQQ